jgi:hypothetical protein
VDIFTGEVGVRIFVHDLKAAEGAHVDTFAWWHRCSCERLECRVEAWQ